MNLSAIIHLNKTGTGVLLCILLLIVLFYAVSNKKDLNSELQLKEQANFSLRKLLNVAIKAAENGGKEVYQNRKNIKVKSKGLTKEGLIDSVTTADFLSHCSMMKTIRNFYPFKIISEEANTVCDNDRYVDLSLPDVIDKNVPHEYIDGNDLTVWIDPLDATYEFAEKLYNYVTVMVCVAVKGKPIIGVIHKPFNKTTSWAWINKTRSKDLNQQVYKANKNNLKVIISRSHKGQIEDVLHKNFNKIDLVIAAGAGYKALELAKGNVDAYLHITAIKKWDICAGNAIIDSLGGKMTTKYNEEIDYSAASDVKNENGVIATMNNHDLFLGKL